VANWAQRKNDYVCPCKIGNAHRKVPPGDSRLGSDILNWCCRCKQFVSYGTAHFWPAKKVEPIMTKSEAQKWIEERGAEWISSQG
jgi:hypothetical protein